MGWEMESKYRTLYITKQPQSEGKTTYRLNQIMKVVDKVTGATYMEPIPSKGILTGFAGVYDFDAVEFVEDQGTARSDKDGALKVQNFRAMGTSGS